MGEGAWRALSKGEWLHQRYCFVGENYSLDGNELAEEYELILLYGQGARQMMDEQRDEQSILKWF